MTQNYLQNAKKDYYLTSGIENAYLADLLKKTQKIKKVVKNPKRIMVFGIGSGAELLAIRKIFNNEATEIIGIDISDKALTVTKKNILKSNLPNSEKIILKKHDLTKSIPPYKNKIDLIVMTAFIHEIYSYNKNPSESVEKTINVAKELPLKYFLKYL